MKFCDKGVTAPGSKLSLWVKSIDSGEDNNRNVSNKTRIKTAAATKTEVTPNVCAAVP